MALAEGRQLQSQGRSVLQIRTASPELDHVANGLAAGSVRWENRVASGRSTEQWAGRKVRCEIRYCLDGKEKGRKHKTNDQVQFARLTPPLHQPSLALERWERDAGMRPEKMPGLTKKCRWRNQNSIGDSQCEARERDERSHFGDAAAQCLILYNILCCGENRWLIQT